MEPYLLTIEDIDNLAAKGFDMNGVAAGSEAMGAEFDALNLSMPAPTAAQLEYAAAKAARSSPASLNIPVPAPLSKSENAAKALNVSAEDLAFMTNPTAPTDGPAPAAAPSGTSTMQQLMALMAPAPAPRSSDPFENLSKTQRRMLAFSAMSDAGAALAGRQGGSFNSMLGRFGEMEDMNRKRTAAENQQAMMSRLMGGAGAGTGAGGTIEERTQAAMRLMLNPATAAFGQAMLGQLEAERERALVTDEAFVVNQNALITANMGVDAADFILNSPNLDAITGFTGNFNAMRNKFGVAGGEYAELMGYVEQIKGLNFLEAYKSLKGSGQITEIEGKQATQARSRIDAALSGDPASLIQAVKSVRNLFQQAREANPSYVPPAAAPVVAATATPTQTQRLVYNAETGEFE